MKEGKFNLHFWGLFLCDFSVVLTPLEPARAQRIAEHLLGGLCFH